MHRATGQGQYLNTCIESFDYAIDNLFSPQNTFIDSANSATGLERIVFSTHLAWSLYVLGNTISEPRRTKWLTAIKSNVEALEASGELTWYSNGNWVANQVRMLYLTAQVCKQSGDLAGYARYNILYERNYTFLTKPWTVPVPNFPTGNAQWTGYGLITDVAGGWTDWSDTQAHLTEVLGGPPMPNAGAGSSWNGQAPFSTFDGDYAGLQMDHLCQWFVASRDVRALKILNGVANKYFSLVDTTTWIGNFSNQSRHSNATNPTFTPSLAVLTLLGQRLATSSTYTDVKVLDHWDKMIVPNLSIANPGYGVCRSYVNVLGTVLLACEQAQLRL
jgi:hypothetical protein